MGERGEEHRRDGRKRQMEAVIIYHQSLFLWSGGRNLSGKYIFLFSFRNDLDFSSAALLSFFLWTLFLWFGKSRFSCGFKLRTIGLGISLQFTSVLTFLIRFISMFKWKVHASIKNQIQNVLSSCNATFVKGWRNFLKHPLSSTFARKKQKGEKSRKRCVKEFFLSLFFMRQREETE